MRKSEADTRADPLEAIDRGEPVDGMEPLLVPEGSRHRARLIDLALELTAHSAGFHRSLPEGLRTALADLVRAMNCYYSNLIEGHDTHPIDIERALRDDYSDDPQKRNLQLEAKAHVVVQRWIDEGGLHGREATRDAICEVHRRFTELLPDELRWVENPDTGDRLRVVPGKPRGRDVRVGQHIPISPGAVPRFLERFESVYNSLSKADLILAAASAHHRLVWIHPFLDGNGRVARLISHALLLRALNTGGIWSVARGLARNVDAYRSQLAACDGPRRNDLDGRGPLSEESLAAFVCFFLEVCLDQVKFMESLVQPDRLRSRILLWVEEEVRNSALPAKARKVLEAVLYRGQLPRGEVSEVLDTTDRQARRVVSALTACGVLTSKTSRSPFHLAFPIKLAPRWMPGLFP